ncbi:NGG1p interacting factor 3 [Encephalitozoon hellem]|uniref:GTP cyclohydrolase n=1 Tax=Encephalitozoon hellem TaxID=27973 RepID=A0A9Q9F9N2_ENCHE|nr:NGG1p interacting factor 3-like protein [Encephalitozoon hellem ATCC 50504]AFM98533.1 NGG1p interacting factor 3-like protein [Encephalitozoon hellem ATCC 50504]KAG5858587.1 NGG1p interacting factor 3 [Encephalitozoon hellem]UTX43476.1 NIF3-like protein 1 [Encephalitozoon hellem]WEL38950.1 putative GTP cyclohydrolase [Encephalitozoon hellem]|eukprot:XP_003887514.1 NGG1p interacting factor 3-like protein [Encephalitozoon hellem ATCC 50504]
MSIQEVGKAIGRFASLRRAKTDWDNVGVIVDSGSQNNKILLTIDLTEPVLEECIELGAKNIVAYHPIIFKAIKKLGSKESVVIECIKNGISVFTPHTALDPLMNTYVYNLINNGAFLYKKNCGPNTSTIRNAISILKEKSGMENFRICLARGHTMESIPEYMHVGVGATFRNIPLKNSIVVTGEMNHHDLLSCIANNATVILMEHSNSERICLKYISEKLQEELPDYEIFISAKDKDPVTIV